jgi:hypothetical protein
MFELFLIVMQSFFCCITGFFNYVLTIMNVMQQVVKGSRVVGWRTKGGFVTQKSKCTGITYVACPIGALQSRKIMIQAYYIYSFVQQLLM